MTPTYQGGPTAQIASTPDTTPPRPIIARCGWVAKLRSSLDMWPWSSCKCGLIWYQLNLSCVGKSGISAACCVLPEALVDETSCCD